MLQMTVVISDVMMCGYKSYTVNMFMGEEREGLSEGIIDTLTLRHRFFSMNWIGPAKWARALLDPLPFTSPYIFLFAFVYLMCCIWKLLMHCKAENLHLSLLVTHVLHWIKIWAWKLAPSSLQFSHSDTRFYFSTLSYSDTLVSNVLTPHTLTLGSLLTTHHTLTGEVGTPASHCLIYFITIMWSSIGVYTYK